MATGDYAMLVLTRRVGETLMVGDNVTVTVLRVRGNEALLEVVAQKNVRVDREEIRIQKNAATDDTFVILPKLDQDSEKFGHLRISRRGGQSFLIGDEITVTVTKINEGQVGLGVEAPRYITVNRKEIHDRINAGSPKDDDVIDIKPARRGDQPPDGPLNPPPSRGPEGSRRRVLSRMHR